MRDMYQRMKEEGRGVPMLVGLFVCLFFHDGIGGKRFSSL